ncbi:MAG TPA: chalcone isomerase family protein [Flavobacterium sp.]|uniref:chalcone isomerase family protein n=1 Tax=Flavobacterium sp. TaxID=239 RepID=UPI002DB6C67B|nr:chalcone isomerase family protein [Flavobacterium sp.]HEU4790713.1 chalcone isomerase family protein [Flavobacterium sp.]
MKKIVLAITLIISAIFSVANAQQQIVFEGVTIPRTMAFENKTLQLNGAGSRSKMWVEVYIQALYLSQLSQNPKEIINDNLEMSIRIEITSALVSSGKLTRALNAGFEKSAGTEFNTLKPKMELLKSYLAEEIKRGDVFELTYNPIDSSVWVTKNGTLKGKVPGFDFKKVFFGIWLGDNPVDEELKNSLLGV